jgi:hypothetical protein
MVEDSGVKEAEKRLDRQQPIFGADSDPSEEDDPVYVCNWIEI